MNAMSVPQHNFETGVKSFCVRALLHTGHVQLCTFL